MARMIPSPMQQKESLGEVIVYDALEAALPRAVTVLHHVQWVQKVSGRLSPDGETDFVIVHPRRGALILEVKGGEIRYVAEMGKWFSRSRNGRINEIKDPFYQARSACHSLLRFVKMLPSWPGDWGPIGYAVCFPDGEFVSAPLPQTPREIIIDGPQLDPARLGGRIEAIFDFLADRRFEVSQGGAERLIKALAHDLEIRLPLSMQLQEADREIIRLSETQFRALDYLSGARRVAVAGPAGSGKTLIAAEKARRLAFEGKRVLFLCYNSALAAFLRELPALSEAKTAPIDVMTYHELCGTLASEAGVRLSAKPEDPAVFEELPVALEAAADLLGPRYDAIIVDEAQDFAEEWWLPLLTLLEDPDQGILYIFFDDNQAIYRRPRGMPDGLLEVPLNENWRNTREIHESVMEYYRGPSVRSLGPGGPAVERVEVKEGTLSKELGRTLHRIIVEGGVAASDVVVLTPRSVRKSQLAGQTGQFRLSESPSGPRDVLLSSIHRYKGLDAQVVVVCEVQGEPEEEQRELMYVACSRARGLLVLLTSG